MNLEHKDHADERPEMFSFGNSSKDVDVLSIRFDYKTKLFFAFLVIYLLITTVFNLNGSSVGIWNKLLNQKNDSGALLGTPKNVRVDEWAVHTPAILSQYNNVASFSTENYSLGGHKSPLLMNVPVKHFSTIMRPQYWLFFITGAERAYAFFWNFKLVILLTGTFILLMLLLENNFFLSLFGSLWIFFSGYVQWWYSSPILLSEQIGYFGIFTAAIIVSIVARKTISIVLACLIFVISFFNFAISLYPPHQVPLVYLSILIVIGMLCPYCKDIFTEFHFHRFRSICLGVALVCTVGLLLLWFLDTKQTLNAVTHTVYPGQRRAAGGGMSVAQIFSGFFGIFTTENNFPKIWSNVCESSNFFILFPVPMVLMFWKWLTNKRVCSLESVLAVFIVTILIWQIAGYPELVSRFTLFDRVTEKRALLPLGIASIIWTCVSLHYLIKERVVFSSKFKLTLVAAVLVSVVLHSYLFNAVTENFANIYMLLAVAVFAVVAVLLFLNRKQLIFAGLILVPNIWSHGLVNPVRIGLQPILGNPIYKDIHRIAHTEPDSKWIVFSTGYQLIANLAFSTGAKVFNGHKYLPHTAEMEIISTRKEDVDVYNRYSCIVVLPAKDPHIRFRMSSSADSYMISADPDNAIWKRLGVTQFLMVSENRLHFLKP